jgi:hypothetical protein
MVRQLRRLAETFDRDVFRTQDNRFDVMFRALAPGDVDLFLDATSFFDYQDFFQYWNDQGVAFLPRRGRLGQGHDFVDENMLYVDFFAPQMFIDLMWLLVHRLMNPHASGIDFPDFDPELFLHLRHGDGAFSVTVRRVRFHE